MLEGKVALVTGAGGGIGREIARRDGGRRRRGAWSTISAPRCPARAAPRRRREQTKAIIEQRGGSAAISTD